jgi:hypothetical protein
MGSLERRLGDLEAHADKSREDKGAAESCRVLRRMTNDELRAYEGALRRMLDGEELAPDDAAILARVQELREEVMGGYQAASW